MPKVKINTATIGTNSDLALCLVKKEGFSPALELAESAVAAGAEFITFPFMMV